LEEAELIAKGRVWSGRDALKLGLIDGIGSLDDAIIKAKSLAGVKDYSLKEYNQTKNNFSLIKDILTLFNLKEDFDSRNIFLDNLKSEFLSIFKWSEKLNDRNQIYYICEECTTNN
jgi:protease-4